MSEPAGDSTALVLIDLQKGMADPAAGERNNPDAETRIAELLKVWRNAGRPVVHVRHVSLEPDSPFWPGQSGAEFQEAFLPRGGEHVVEKHVPDAFTHSGLERWLHVRGIGALVLVGVSTENSVESTARSAGNLGFRVQVVDDATFTFARRDIRGEWCTADEVHSHALTSLHGEYARVVMAGSLMDT